MRYFLIFIFLFTQAQEQSNLMIDSFQTFKSYASTKYDQVLRPQFHFSSKKNWINDPNGLVYYKGEYHMFFQHNPKSINWGNMTWGHAISRDMIKWVQLPHAILPYGNGTIFSGTAVVDNMNSLGKNTEKEKAEKIALSSDKIQPYLVNQTINRIIYVPDKLVNIVIT